MVLKCVDKPLIVSRYSYFFKTSKGDFLAYSSKSNSFLEISEVLYDLLKFTSTCDKKELPIDKIPQDIIDILINEGFVCTKYDDDDYVSKNQFITQSIQYNKSRLGLVIAPTLNCNFDCPYCFESNKTFKYINDATIDNIIDFIKKHSSAELLKLTWYGGEPLLALNKIENILENITEKIGIEINDHTLITNGYLFDENAVRLFKKYPLKSIQITLDGVKCRHDELRALKNSQSKGTYDKILKNIKLISDELPNTELHIRVNIDKNNKDDYFKVYEELKDTIGLKNKIVYPGIIRIENKEKTELVYPAFARDETSNYLFDIMKMGYINGQVFPTRMVSKTCTANCVNSYIIGPSGEIYKCWNDVSDPNKIVGYITEDKITNTSLYYRYHQGCSWYNDSECKTCFYMPICNGKCIWYNERNIYHSGTYNLCQCLQKSPGLLDQTLEYYYEHNILSFENNKI